MRLSSTGHRERILLRFGRGTMTVCPIAIVAGCAKCPAFKVCPLKGVLGDQGKEEPPKGKAAPASTKRTKKAN
jgi:hypothetical protein